LFESLNSFHDHFFRCAQVPEEIVAAMEIVERQAPRRILEIGTARGGTLFLFSRAAAPDALLVSLDLPQGKYGGGYSAWKTRVFRRLLRTGQRAGFVRADSHERASLDRIRQYFKGEKLDLLFIDGDHTHEGVKQDYELYSPLVRDGGLIVFHDIAKHRPELECHVDRFWDEVKGGFQSQEIIADRQQGWAGIGILN
jgi:predicted O-methyltransferase YrrM